ncbi:MAG: homoserine dehydrogenase [Oscillospiraceae bacterium]|nr:homoserine dehydrogenase [Oscillospiraceae bacterium]
MINIAVLGYGTVGSGVVSLLDKNAASISGKIGQDIKVKYILDIRDFGGDPFGSLFVKTFDTIVNDPQIAIVVEAIGGTGAALEYTRRSLEAGKSVITSNKELVAEHGSDLIKLAMSKEVNYLFEASVGGGIPLIRPLAECLSANIISEIYGILNGTTNYILTSMKKDNASFDDALFKAQQEGYAESDPTADIEGHDTCRKICILASLAFGRHIYPNEAPTTGISNVSISDMLYAKSLGYEIKLLGRAKAVGDKVAVYVAPHLISTLHTLSGINYVMNGVMIRGNAVGSVLLCGPGAGKMPTASAVAGDIMNAAKHLKARKWIGWSDADKGFAADPELLDSAWYIRTDAPRDKIERVFGSVIFANDGLSDADRISNAKNAENTFITSVINGSKVDELLSHGIFAKSKFRVLGDH